MDAEQAEKRKCNNCLQLISTDVFQLHELRCAKHTMLCNVCQQPVSREEFEQHFEEEHAPATCKYCGIKVPKDEMASHEESTCPEYRIDCKYCELEISRKDYSDHVEGCGGRTDVCELCNQRVRLRDMEEHKQNKCRHGTSTETESSSTGGGASYSFQGGEGGFHFPLGGLYADSSISHDLYSNTLGHPFFGGGGGSSSVVQLPTQHSAHAHPFVPLPTTATSHTQADAHSSKDNSLQIDSQWLASVSNACGEEGLDQMLAQNMMVEDYCRKSPPPPQYNREEFHPKTLQEEGSSRREDVPAGGAANHMSTTESDAELARRIHERDMAYAERQKEVTQHLSSSPPHDQEDFGVPAGGMANHVSTTESDAELARRIHERDMAYAERQRIDRELAERLQEEERRANFNRNFYTPEVAYSQQEKQQEALGGYQQDQEQPIREAAEMFPRGGGGGFDLGVQEGVRQQKRARYYGGVGPTSDDDDDDNDDDQPRPKTSPPEDQIPCEYCNELYPFEVIYEHQQKCPASLNIPAFLASESERKLYRPPLREGREESSSRVDQDHQYFQSSHFGQEEHYSQSQVSSSRRDREPVNPTLLAHTSGKRYPSFGEEHSPPEEKPQQRQPVQEGFVSSRSQESATFLPTTRHLTNRQRGGRGGGGLLYSTRTSGMEMEKDRAQTSAKAYDYGEEASGPCETCHKLFPLEELVKHESICRYMLSRKVETTDIKPETTLGPDGARGRTERVKPRSKPSSSAMLHAKEPLHHQVQRVSIHQSLSSSSSSSSESRRYSPASGPHIKKLSGFPDQKKSGLSTKRAPSGSLYSQSSNTSHHSTSHHSSSNHSFGRSSFNSSSSNSSRAGSSNRSVVGPGRGAAGEWTVEGRKAPTTTTTTGGRRLNGSTGTVKKDKPSY